MSLQAGQWTQLAPTVRRLVAPNGGKMTGAGTNSYLLGLQRPWILDPGPDELPHLQSLLQACDGGVSGILLTHTHPDHSPGAKWLAQQTGAPVLGLATADDGMQDRSCVFTRQLVDNEWLGQAPTAIQVVATPGHVDNHLCYWLPSEKILFTGDHILGGTTTVIVPPGGDMADYLASLEKLKPLGVEHIAPGHGELLDDPIGIIDGLIAHRLKREQKVVDALKAAQQAPLSQLLPVVYDDVDPALLPIALISLWAHLLKLEREQLARRHNHKADDLMNEVWGWG